MSKIDEDSPMSAIAAKGKVDAKATLKPVKISAKYTAPVISAPSVVPIKKRQLVFGHKWDYAPAPETVPVKIDPRHELFIDGKFVAPHSGQYFDSINPATEAKLCEIARGDEQDVGRAVAAARRAFETVWGRMPGRERGKYLYR